MKSPSHFIGRSGEIERLTAAIAATRPVAVVGPAGIGKTYLLLHVLGSTGRRARIGGAVDFMEWRSWLPLERALGKPITAGDPEAVAEDVAAELGRDVLFLDDLQWADPETLSALDALAARLSVVATARDGTAGEKAIRALSEAGFEVLELTPLTPAEVRDLIAQHGASVTDREFEGIVRRSGGNPFFVEQLLVTGDERWQAIEDVVAVRLAELSHVAQHDILLLALAGRPICSTLLRSRRQDLRSRGLITEGDDGISLVADLVGEVAVRRATTEQIQAVHLVLAAHTSDPGARARHLAGADQLTEALEAALAAADATDRPTERARELELAGQMAERLGRIEDATAHRLGAAEIFLLTGVPEESLRVLDHTHPKHPDERSTSHVLTASAHLLAGHHGAALDRIEVALNEQPSDHVRSQLIGLRAASRALGRFDLTGARQDAQESIEMATRTGAPKRYAQHLLAGLDAMEGIDGWSDRFRDALDAARAEGDLTRELEIANTLTLALFMHARIDQATSMCDEGMHRAHALRQRSWELRLRTTRATQLFFPSGASDEVLAELRDLASEPTLSSNRSGVVGLLCLARADGGDRTAYTDVACEISRYGPAEHMAWHGLQWLAAEIALVNGAYSTAIDHAQAVLASDGAGSPAFDGSTVVLRWAQLLLGNPVTGPDPAGSLPAFAGLVYEAQAVQLMSTGTYDDAATSFAEAADRHDLYLSRSATRSRLGQVGALQAAGRRDEAIALAKQVRSDADGHGAAAFGSRAAAMLRSLGEPVDRHRLRHAPDCGSTEDQPWSRLTARQTEILLLVANGWTSAAIARQIGLRTSTVESHIRAGMRSLGARSRTEAAMIAAARHR